MASTTQEHMLGERPTEKTLTLLFRGLKIFGVTKEKALDIAMAVYTEEKAMELMRFMAEHQTATPEDIETMAWMIHERAFVRKSLSAKN